MKYIFLIFSACLLLTISGNLFCQEVILIRHAKVYQDSKGWMGHKTAAEFRKDYDTAPVHQFSADSVLKNLPEIISDTIYVSGLPRSIATGWKLFGDSTTFVSMDLMNEFELKIVRWPIVLPYKAWTAVSRGLWSVGLNQKGVESLKEGRQRASEVADFIEEKAKHEKQIVVVFHGFLNYMLTRELKKRGWKIKRKEGNQNLGANILQK